MTKINTIETRRDITNGKGDFTDFTFNNGFFYA